MEATCNISLAAITHNFNFFQKRIGTAQVIPVIKANAYGHGAIELARHLYHTLRVNLFAVATLEEARELISNVPGISVLILSRVYPKELHQLPENIILTLGSMEDVQSINNESVPGIRAHLNVNTGMNRLGLSPEQAVAVISDQNSALDIQGVYSHFSSSDTESEIIYDQQNQIFKQFVIRIKTLGFTGMVHLSNSAGALHDGARFYDAIRLGIGLYGYDTSAGGRYLTQLMPAMEVKAPLVRVDRIRAGESVSYAEKWQAAIDTNIGTLRIGYADGYNRKLTNRGVVTYNGKDYPVIGTITMDHIMIDLGDDEPSTGNLFTVMGGSSRAVQIASIAKILNTITYEICCGISSRVKYLY